MRAVIFHQQEGKNLQTGSYSLEGIRFPVLQLLFKQFFYQGFSALFHKQDIIGQPEPVLIVFIKGPKYCVPALQETHVRKVPAVCFFINTVLLPENFFYDVSIHCLPSCFSPFGLHNVYIRHPVM